METKRLNRIADSMDVRELETRYYALEGMKQHSYRNELLAEMQERLKDDMPFGRTITSIGWKIGPLINGCVRYGSEKEQKDMFRAILGEQEDIFYQPRRKHKEDPKPAPELHTLQWDVARNLVNIKSRQDTEVRKFVKELEADIKEKGLDKNSVIFVDGTKVLTKGTVSGLVANKLASQYFRPVVLMRSKNADEYGGSMRNYSSGILENLKEFLEKTGKISTAGHANAAGVMFKKADLQDIIDRCNVMMPIETLATVHEVDWEIPANKLKKEYIQEVAENYAVFGNTVPEPLFAITDICINASQIHGYGEHNSFIRFTYNGINFTKKYCSYEDYDNMTLTGLNTFGVSKKNVKINAICQFVLNAWEDKVTPEVKILFFDSVEDFEAKNDLGVTSSVSDKKSTTVKKKNDDFSDFEPVMVKKKDEYDDFDW